MESPSDTLHCGCNSWKKLLITASILSCCIQSTTARGDATTVVPNPPHGAVGSGVILNIHGFSGNVFSYSWYKGSTEEKNKIAYYNVPSASQTPPDIREKVFSNGSLFIPNLTFNDTDNYTVLIIEQSGQTSQVVGHLGVYERLSTPIITVNNHSNIIENGTLVFICNTIQKGMSISWFFKDQLLPPSERINLSENNQTLTIQSVKRGNAGSYRCEIRNPVSHKRSSALVLTVYFGPDNIRFPLSPEREELEVEFKDQLKLECKVESYPDAQHKWKVNGSIIPDLSSNTFIIKNLSWKDSGKYTCLARNNITNLSVSKDITLKVVGKENGFSISRGSVFGIVIAVLTGVTLIGAIIYFLFFRKTARINKNYLSKMDSSAPKQGEDTNLYENTAYLKGSAQPAQSLGFSSTTHEDQTENTYQTLVISKMDVYDELTPGKNPQK